jgi:hypothetical protein
MTEEEMDAEIQSSAHHGLSLPGLSNQQDLIAGVSFAADNYYFDTTSAWSEAGYIHLGVMFNALSQSLTSILRLSAAEHAHDKLHLTLVQVRSNVWVVEPLALQVARTAPAYDFPGVAGNGYRSLLALTFTCIRELHSVADDCSKHWKSIWSRKSTIRRHLIEYGVSVLDNLLSKLLETALSLHATSVAGQLFSSQREYEDVLAECLQINKVAILGKWVCFHLRPLSSPLAQSLGIPVPTGHEAVFQAFARHQGQLRHSL